MSTLVAELLVLAGSAFVLLAGAGVMRFSDVYARMHAATKASALGMVLIGVGAALSIDAGRSTTLVAVAFILVTAPTAAHFIGRAAYRAEGVEIDLAGRDDLAALLDDEGGPADASGT